MEISSRFTFILGGAESRPNKQAFVAITLFPVFLTLSIWLKKKNFYPWCLVTMFHISLNSIIHTWNCYLHISQQCKDSNNTITDGGSTSTRSRLERVSWTKFLRKLMKLLPRIFETPAHHWDQKLPKFPHRNPLKTSCLSENVMKECEKVLIQPFHWMRFRRGLRCGHFATSAD